MTLSVPPSLPLEAQATAAGAPADASNAQELLQGAIADAQSGRASGFEVILQLYGRRLYGFFYRATSNSHDAEDLVSELMLRLIRRLKHYQHRDRFEPWLFRIAANMARDRIRGLRVRPAVLSLSREGEGEPSTIDPPCRAGCPLDGALADAERTGRLQAMLDRLDATTRGMILLRFFGDMSFQELADTFGCPIGTALAKVHRGMQSLRRQAERPAIGEREEPARAAVSPAPSRPRRTKKATGPAACPA